MKKCIKKFCFKKVFIDNFSLSGNFAYYSQNEVKHSTCLSGKGVSKSESTTLKAHSLITVADLMQLLQNQAIIFLSKENPAKTKLVPWWTINTPISKDNNPIKTLELIYFDKNYYYNIKKNY